MSEIFPILALLALCWGLGFIIVLVDDWCLWKGKKRDE